MPWLASVAVNNMGRTVCHHLTDPDSTGNLLSWFLVTISIFIVAHSHLMEFILVSFYLWLALYLHRNLFTISGVALPALLEALYKKSNWTLLNYSQHSRTKHLVFVWLFRRIMIYNHTIDEASRRKRSGLSCYTIPTRPCTRIIKTDCWVTIYPD